MTNLDEAVNQAGGFGCFQILLTVSSMMIVVLIGANLAASIFIAMEPKSRCKSPYEQFLKEKCPTDFQRFLVPALDGKLSNCQRYSFTNFEKSILPMIEAANSTSDCSIKMNLSEASVVACSDWEFDRSVMRSTIATDFNLVCGEEWAAYLSQSSLMLGLGFGGVIMGYVSDRIGRMQTLLFVCIGMTIFGTLLAFTENLLHYTIMQVLAGFFVYCPYIVLFVYASELTIPRYRSIVAQALALCFPLGFMYLALSSYLLRDWRHVQLMNSAPFAAGILLWWFLPESPRWLYHKNRKDEAFRVLHDLAKFNRVSHINTFESNEEFQDNIPLIADKANLKIDIQEENALKSLFTRPNLRSASLKMFFNWFSVSCVYYGLTLNAAEMDGDPFSNLVLNAAVDITAAIITVPVANIYGRRVTSSVSKVLTGFLCILIPVVPHNGVLPVAMVGKFFISIAFSLMTIHANEIYPTAVRSLGIGLCSAMARIGGVASPLIAMLGMVSKSVPYFIFGILPLLSAILVLTLPETKGFKLPETIQEGEEFVQSDSGVLKNICRREYKYIQGRPSE